MSCIYLTFFHSLLLGVPRYNCKKSILISKVDDPNSKKKLDQWELDSVTPYQCPAKKKTPAVTTVDNGSQLAELTKQVSDLKETVNILISQIQMLRNDIKKIK